MSNGVVTRFAPSPTGFLHIGGARTAMFNWLYAKRMGGKMLLRIEDTDRARSTPDAVDALIDGLSWLGLDWQGEPVSQFARRDRHAQIAHQLLEAGHAYRCYTSPEELAAMREQARADGRPPRYDGRWRDRDPSEAPTNVEPVIRIKAPQSGETIVNDVVQGEVRFPNADLDDFVILRSDGTPTYMLAVVVDDRDMGITHIVRGDDHLTNAARQQIIYDHMGWQVPVMAHIPLIHGPDGAKLSKRHGALGAEAYRAMGFLPAALRNYLARLGWSHGDDEIISTEQMIEWFDITDINKGAARFDIAKLEALNGHYVRHADDEELMTQIMALLPHKEGGAPILEKLTDPSRREQLRAAMPGLKERAKTLVQLIDSADYLFAERPLVLDDKAAAILDADARALLGKAHAALDGLEIWDAEHLDRAIRAFADHEGLKLGKVAQPLRAALTGQATSPGVFDVLAVLGRNEALARIADISH